MEFQLDDRPIDFSKGLVPAIVQDWRTGGVLMVGYMNEEALAETCKDRQVVFYSRSKQRLWRKGETSGNFLEVQDIRTDCDRDALLILATPKGPTCHTGAISCFGEELIRGDFSFLASLDCTIESRRSEDAQRSYTAALFREGIDRLAQKVGEEGIEVVIAAKNSDKERLIDECADLLFHLMVLLRGKGSSLAEVVSVLEQRARKAA